jgi:hypothetical protein
VVHTHVLSKVEDRLVPAYSNMKAYRQQERKPPSVPGFGALRKRGVTSRSARFIPDVHRGNK